MRNNRNDNNIINNNNNTSQTDRDANLKQRSSLPAQRLRTIPRLIKTTDYVGSGPRPGAYDVQGRAHGEVPHWTQHRPPQPRQTEHNDTDEKILVGNAEVVPDDEVERPPNVQQIVVASAILETRIGFGRVPFVRRRNRQKQQTLQYEPANTPAVAAAPRIPEGEPIAVQGQRRSVGSLLDDNEEEQCVHDRFVQGLHSTLVGTRDEITEDHPHFQSVREVFPTANTNRIKELLRQESLATTFIILAEESNSAPSDEVAGPTELKYATTYAQATDEDRAVIMSYLIEMFPNVCRKQIETVLMENSTHQGVALLSERLSAEPPPTNVPPVAAAYKPKKPSLIDDDEEEEEIDHYRNLAPWMQGGSLSEEQPLSLEKKRSASHDEVVQRVIQESKGMSLEDSDGKLPPRVCEVEDQWLSQMGNQLELPTDPNAYDELGNLKQPAKKPPPVAGFYDLDKLKNN